MKWIALAMMVAAAVAPAEGQVRNTQEGEAILGVVGQNDTQQLLGVKLSPVGINIGFIVQPLFDNRRLSVVEQLSFVPVIRYERQRSPFGTQFVGRNKPLIVNNLWARLSSDEPEVSGSNVYFVGGGISFAVATPRDGTKATPMLGIGMRRWFARQMGFEVSLQCGVQEIGRTACTLPMTSVWPFG